MRKLVAFFIASTFLIVSCEQRAADRASTSETESSTPGAASYNSSIILQDPIIPTIVELPTHALPVWREHRQIKPTLILFSNDPFLKAIPAAIAKDADNLVRDGSIEDLMNGLDIMTANPVLMQDMAVSAAINSELFGAIYWVVATSEDILEQSAESIQNHLLRYGAFTAGQAPLFSKTADGFVGTIDNIPFHVIPPESLPELKSPISLHFDLSYFAGIYLDEVRSPLFPLIKDLFREIKDMQWQALSVTVSLNHASGNRSLKSRYLGPVLAGFFNDPDRLDSQLSQGLSVREKILYLDTFFQNETILTLYQEALELAPEDPSLHYGLYRLYRQMKNHDLAMNELQQAIRLDRTYALEYQHLAQQAKEQGQKLMAMDFLQLAMQAFPENVFFKLQLAETYLDVNAPERAIPLIKALQDEPWSDIYYVQVPSLLNRWLEQAKETSQTTIDINSGTG